MTVPETLTECLQEIQIRNMAEIGNSFKANALVLISKCICTLSLSLSFSLSLPVLHLILLFSECVVWKTVGNIKSSGNLVQEYRIFVPVLKWFASYLQNQNIVFHHQYLFTKIMGLVLR